MKCPRCDADASGRFCGSCGATLAKQECGHCRTHVPPGHRYCSECGAEQGAAAVVGRTPPDPVTLPTDPSVPLSATTSPSDPTTAPPPPGASPSTHLGKAEGDAVGHEATHSSSLEHKGWWIIGAAVLAGAVFLAVPYVWTGWTDGGNGERMPMGAVAPAAPQGGVAGMALGGGTDVDLSSMTPREAADRLFNRVMTALGDGDTAEVESFLPMALDAYAMVPDLDADGHFHVSLLQQAQGDHQGGMETAEIVLEEEPDHLLARYAAGEAARNLGDRDRAREHFAHLLEVFDQEAARDLPEYQEHASFLPTIQATAEDFLTTGGA
jgi:hypothetical protein